MALAVFFLLCGMLAAEVALLGIAPAGVLGACFLAASAITLYRRRSTTWTATGG